MARNARKARYCGYRLVTRALLILGSFVLGLLIAEFTVRRFYPVRWYYDPPNTINSPAVPIIHQRSDIPGLYYELKPESKTIFVGAEVTINSAGMRDAEPLPADTQNLCRIVALGDSETFGWGVPGELAWPNLLELVLNKESAMSGQRFEVLNFGVSGYTTQDEMLVLKHKAMAYRPNLIVIGYVLNDPEISALSPLRSYFLPMKTWRYSHLARMIHRWSMNASSKRCGSYLHYITSDPRKWKSVVEGFANIREAAAEVGVPVVLSMHVALEARSWDHYPFSDLHKKVAELGRRNDFHVVSHLDSFKKHDTEKLKISAKDPHPTAFGHALYARTIYDYLLQNPNMLPCLHSKIQPSK